MGDEVPAVDEQGNIGTFRRSGGGGGGCLGTIILLIVAAVIAVISGIVYGGVWLGNWILNHMVNKYSGYGLGLFAAAVVFLLLNSETTSILAFMFLMVAIGFFVEGATEHATAYQVIATPQLPRFQFPPRRTGGGLFVPKALDEQNRPDE